MLWKKVRCTNDLHAWNSYFAELTPMEKAKIIEEMHEYLDQDKINRPSASLDASTSRQPIKPATQGRRVRRSRTR